MSLSSRNRLGFSMIEVLLALVIGGLVLTAATALLITISGAWANRPATRDAFDAHVNGVAYFLNSTIEEAVLPDVVKAGSERFDLRRPVGFSRSDDPLIHFYLKEGPPLFFWPNGPAPRIHCFFYFEEGEGLSFLWFSELQELEKNQENGLMEPEDSADLFKTMISPFCSEVFYCYYGEEGAAKDDFNEWEILDDLEENTISGKYRMPDFIKFVFTWDEEGLERTISLPIRSVYPNGIKEEPDERK